MTLVSIDMVSVLLALFMLTLWSCLHVHLRGGKRTPRKEATPACPKCNSPMWGLSSGSSATGFSSVYICEKCGWQTATAYGKSPEETLCTAYTELKDARINADANISGNDKVMNCSG